MRLVQATEQIDELTAMQAHVHIQSLLCITVKLQEGEKGRMAKNDLANLQLVNHIHDLTAEIAALKADSGKK